MRPRTEQIAATRLSIARYVHVLIWPGYTPSLSAVC